MLYTYDHTVTLLKLCTRLSTLIYYTAMYSRTSRKRRYPCGISVHHIRSSLYSPAQQCSLTRWSEPTCIKVAVTNERT